MKNVNTNEKKPSEWFKLFFPTIISIAVTIIIFLFQNSFTNGQIDTRITTLESSVKELKDVDANFYSKNESQSAVIQKLDVGIAELKVSSKYQEELLNDLKKIVSEKRK